MNSGSCIRLGLVFFLVLSCILSVLGADNTASSTPGTVTTSASGKNATKTASSPLGKGPEDDEDCVDEEPEPEATAKNSTSGENRQGKGLVVIVGKDKEKYTHENATAEPEPEGEPGTNSTSGTNDKLTSGNATTKAHAQGAATSTINKFMQNLVLGLSLGTVFCAVLI